MTGCQKFGRTWEKGIALPMVFKRFGTSFVDFLLRDASSHESENESTPGTQHVDYALVPRNVLMLDAVTINCVMPVREDQVWRR